MINDGQADSIKSDLTDEIEALENTKTRLAPVLVVRRAKALLDKLRVTTRWDDSRSDISAKFYNLINDTEEYRGYAAYADISARARSLVAWGAVRLTPMEALAENVVGLQRTNQQAADQFQASTQRLYRPGGMAWEVARETPEPFVDEAVRRGGQVKIVAGEVAEEVKPVGQALIDELDSQGVTNPALGIIILGMIVFMKNKILAGLLSLGLIYLVKNKQISAVTDKISSVTDKVSSVADKADRLVN